MEGLCLHPEDLIFRIYLSFMPPLRKNYQKIYVDYVGPLIAIFLLSAFLWYGHTTKIAQLSFSPVEFVASYVILMPILCYVLSKLGNSDIKFSQAFVIVGYALYGHLVTLILSFLYFNEESDFFFFICLTIFGGLSTLRLSLLLLNLISIPVVRLIVCSTVSVVNILYLLLFHFGYMHRTYKYYDYEDLITID